MSFESLTPEITSFVNAFLSGKVLKKSPGRESQSIEIKELISSLLLEINASEEIQNDCIKIDSILTGTYLGNHVVKQLHPTVNDKDFKINFTVKEGVDPAALYEKVHSIACKYFNRQLTGRESPCSLKSIGIKEMYAYLGGRAIASYTLKGDFKDLPLELGLTIMDSSWRSHLTSVDSFYVPIHLFDGELGSERPGEFTLHSKEGGREVLESLKERMILPPQTPLEKDRVSSFELARYLIWISERWKEPIDHVFSCLYQGTIEKTPPQNGQLLRTLLTHVDKKRGEFPSYPVFYLLNFILQANPSDREFLLKELETLWQGQKPPLTEKLYQKLYPKKGEVNPFDCLLVQIPLLAQEVRIVDHLGKKQLQCLFNKETFSILVPIPDEGKSLWLQNILEEDSYGDRSLKLVSLVQPDFCPILERVLPRCKEDSGLWQRFKEISKFKPLEFLQTLSFKREDIWDQILSLEDTIDLSGILRFFGTEILDATPDFLENLFKKYANDQKPWKAFGIRLLMDASEMPKWLRILARKSGMTQILPKDFPNLLNSSDKTWLFWMKLAVLSDSSCLTKALQEPSSEGQILDMRRCFSVELLYPLFHEQVLNKQTENAMRLRSLVKEAFGLVSVLPWYAELRGEGDVLIEALSLGQDPWTLYKIFASDFSALEQITPNLQKDINHLSLEDRKAVLTVLISHIDSLIKRGAFEKALDLACFLPTFAPQENQVAPLLSDLFMKSPASLQGKIVSLIHQLAPNHSKNLVKSWSQSITVLNFNTRSWILALMKEGNVLPLFLEHFKLCAKQFSQEEMLALVEIYTPKASKKQRQQLALLCAQPLNKDLFNKAAPEIWDIPWDNLSLLKSIWSLVQGEEARKSLVSSSFSFVLGQKDIDDLIGEMRPYMKPNHVDLLVKKYRDEVKGVFDSVEKILQKPSTTKGTNRPVLTSLDKQVFCDVLKNDLILYEKLLNLAFSYRDKLWDKELQWIPRFLESAPDGASHDFLALRKDLALFCMHKNKIALPWIVRESCLNLSDEICRQELESLFILDSKVVPVFLQEVAGSLDSLEKPCEIFVFQQIQIAPSLEEQSLRKIAIWVQNKKSEWGIKETMKLSLRSNHLELSKELLDLSVSLFSTNSLVSLFSELVKDYPNFISKELIEDTCTKVANEIESPQKMKNSQSLLRLTSQDSEFFEQCLMSFYPSLSKGRDPLEKLASLKNYLEMICGLDSDLIKKIQIQHLEFLSSSLFELRKWTISPKLAESVLVFLEVCMKSNRKKLVNNVLQSWEVFPDENVDFNQFYHNYFYFFLLLANSHPEFLKKEHVFSFKRFLKEFPEGYKKVIGEAVEICNKLPLETSEKLSVLSGLDPLLNRSTDRKDESMRVFSFLYSVQKVFGKEFDLVGSGLYDEIFSYFREMKSHLPYVEFKSLMKNIINDSKSNEIKFKNLSFFVEFLNPHIDGLDEISYLQTCFNGLFVESIKTREALMSRKAHEAFVDYLIAMNQRFKGDPSISEFSASQFLHSAAACSYFDLMNALINHIHLPNILSFVKEGKRFDVEMDIYAYFTYLGLDPEAGKEGNLIPSETWTAIFEEYQKRGDGARIQNLEQFSLFFFQKIAALDRNSMLKSSILSAIVLFIKFLLKQDSLPFPSHRLQGLLFTAFRCPWEGLDFLDFLEIYYDSLLNVEMSDFKTNYPSLFSESVFMKVADHFIASDLAGCPDSKLSKVWRCFSNEYIGMLSKERSSDKVVFKERFSKILHKVIQEKISSLPDLLESIRQDPQAPEKIKGWIMELDLPTQKKDEAMHIIDALV